jgi:hypothetical protein
MILVIQSCSPEQKIITKEMAGKGEQLFNSVGCTKCHSLTGENMYGPPVKFNYGAEITVIRNGNPKIIELDRGYIIRSMKDPDYEKLKGYEKKKMAKIELSGEAIESITDYLIFINTIQK